jgi:uncharacterized protein (TIGR00645 family)
MASRALEANMNPIERGVERLLLSSRWLIAPFLMGLMVALLALIYRFGLKLFDSALKLNAAEYKDVIVGILSLIDIALVANLILIVICSSYENFIRTINPADHPDLPDELIRIGFSGLKQKLLGSLVAIMAVQILEWFMDFGNHFDPQQLAWGVGILLCFAFAMLILSIADRVSAGMEGH